MKPTTRDGVLRGGMAVGIRLLIATAAGISAYLLSVSLSGGNAVGCAPGSSCDEVLQSNWAYVFGIPVSGLALLVDLAFLFTTFACGPRSTPQQRRSAWEILIPCAVLVLGAAIWFTALQAFIVQRFCPWCMAAHGAGALAAILLLARMPLTEAPAKTGVHKNKVVKLAAGALIALALLGTAQTLSPRKTYSVTHVPNTSPGDASKSAAVSTRPAPPPVLTLFNGRIVLDLTKTPVIGSPEAPLKLLSLYDYTCRHCREMHPHVLELHRNFSNKLAIVSLPMPLDSECNPLLQRTSRAQANACIYARLGLTVWRAQPASIKSFDDWLFSFPSPPALEMVTNKVIEMVGAEAFTRASQDPLVDQLIRTSTDIYAISAKEFGRGNMPQFHMGSNIISGTLNYEQLRGLIAPYAQGL